MDGGKVDDHRRPEIVTVSTDFRQEPTEKSGYAAPHMHIEEWNNRGQMGIALGTPEYILCKEISDEIYKRI